MRRVGIIAGILLVAALSATAAEVPVGNSGFESPAIAAGTFDTTSAPANWTAFGNINFGARTVGVLHPATTALYTNPVPEGQNVGVIFLQPQLGQPSGMFQTLSDPLRTLTHYELTLNIGNIGNDPDPPHNSFNFAGFPGYRVELLAGTNVLAMDDNSLVPDEGSFLATTVAVTIARSHHAESQFLGIRLTNLDQAPGLEVNFDDLQLTATPLVDIGPTAGGMISVTFTGTLEQAGALGGWSPVDPQPSSPFDLSPTNGVNFYRSVEAP